LGLYQSEAKVADFDESIYSEDSRNYLNSKYYFKSIDEFIPKFIEEFIVKYENPENYIKFAKEILANFKSYMLEPKIGNNKFQS